MITFTATIQKVPDMDGAFIEIPFDVQEQFGAKRVKVKASFDGEPYRGSIVSMGGQVILGITKEIRAKIGKQPGDEVEVFVEKDDDPREVDLSSDVIAALKEHGLMEAWNKLSYSHQREYATGIFDAKKEETRKRRISKMIDMLKER